MRKPRIVKKEDQEDGKTKPANGSWTLFDHKDMRRVGARGADMVRLADYNSIDDIKDLVLKQGNNAFSIIKGKYVWIKNIPATKGPEDMTNKRSSQLWIHNVWF